MCCHVLSSCCEFMLCLLASSMQRLTRIVIDSARRVKNKFQIPDVPSLRVLRMAARWNDLYEEERKTSKASQMVAGEREQSQGDCRAQVQTAATVGGCDAAQG